MAKKNNTRPSAFRELLTDAGSKNATAAAVIMINKDGGIVVGYHGLDDKATIALLRETIMLLNEDCGSTHTLESSLLH